MKKLLSLSILLFSMINSAYAAKPALCANKNFALRSNIVSISPSVFINQNASLAVDVSFSKPDCDSTLDTSRYLLVEVYDAQNVLVFQEKMNPKPQALVDRVFSVGSKEQTLRVFSRIMLSKGDRLVSFQYADVKVLPTQETQSVAQLK